ELWIIAPPAVRRQLLGSAGSLAELRNLLSSDGARSFWLGPKSEEREQPVRRWSSQLRRFGETAPADEAERLRDARALHADGRFGAALKVLQAIAGAPAQALRAACHYRLGETPAAREALRRVETAALSPGQLVELAEVAARVLVSLGEPDAAREWI